MTDDPSEPPRDEAADPSGNASPADSLADPDVTQPDAADPDAGARPVAAHRARKKPPWWEMPALILIALVVAVVVKTFLFQPFYIPSQSMEQTLHGCPGCSGDRVLVNKPAYYFNDPSPGDIVVFRAPESWDEEVQFRKDYNPVVGAARWFGQLVGVVPPDEKDLIKRIIATGGQTVRCCDEQGRVQISDNGDAGPWRSLDEPYIFADGAANPTTPFGPVTVPKGRLWVMGDHRNDSADSRAHCDTGSAGADNPGSCDPTRSTVDIDAVIGKAVLIVWPPSRWRTLGTPATFESATAAAGATLPLASGLAVALPIGLIRRKSRRS